MISPSESSHEAHRAVSTFDPSSPCASRRSSRSKFAEKNGAAAEKTSIDAFERIIKLCSIRDRSVQELRERLASDGYMQGPIEDSLKRAVDCSLLDDRRFAELLIRSRLRSGKGACVVRRDLKKHGIIPEEIDGWPDAFEMDEAAQERRALDLLDGFSSTAQDLWSAAFRHLLAKGYSTAVATRVARVWSEKK